MKIHCKNNRGVPFFYSSFVQIILELNDIVCKEEELTESPKILDYGVVKKIRYHRNTNGDYYYLEDSGRKIYDDKIVDPIKEAAETASPFDIGDVATYSSSSNVKTLLDEMLQKLLADNKIIEDNIMARFLRFLMSVWIASRG